MTAMALAPTRRGSVDRPARNLRLVRDGDPTGATRVIVADGQGVTRAGVRAALERAPGITVVGEAATGDDAVALARRAGPDVVLIDVELPGLDCVEATRRMLAHRGVAVMLLTSRGHDDRILPALRAGASGLLLKHSEPGQLVRAVRVLATGAAVLSLLPHPTR
jgi:DNA-binding NarL/FixJ family response regulator